MTPKSVSPVQKVPAKKQYQPPKTILAEHKEFISYVALNIQQIRKNKNITPTQLANKSGVSRTLIYLLEGGKTYFTISALLLILDALETPASDFFKDL